MYLASFLSGYVCNVAGTFDGFVYVRIVESQSAYFNGITGGLALTLKFWYLPVSSHLLNARGWLSSRLRVRRCPQKESVTFTEVKGYGDNGIPVRLVFHLRLTAYGGGNQQGGN